MRFAFGKAPSINARNLEDLESWTKSIWQKMMRFLYCMPHWIIGAESIFQDYNRILLHPATRFIGTMNYGYAGTRELNEALVSRFMVIDMPEMDEDSVLFVLREHFQMGKKVH